MRNYPTFASLLLGVLMLISHSANALTKLTASVNKNPVLINEIIQLDITADASISQSSLDLSVLSKDFRTRGTSSSSNTQIVNGSVSRQTTFSTGLIAKREGKIVIPSFTINGVSTAPIELTVLPLNAQTTQTQKRDIFIESALSSNTAWLQQQLTYTVKLFINRQISLESASLVAPKLENAIVEQQGEDKESDAIENGRRFRVIERTFAITPQKSGEFEIATPIFEGRAIERSSRGGFFNNTTPISRLGNKQKLTVKAIPTDYKGHWLPSNLVQLHDEITPVAKGEYKVGDPITRTVTLSALDVSETLLPEITANYPSSVKTYSDQAETKSATRNGRYIAQRIESTAIIPNQAGTITLPAITVNWWNTQYERMETATVEARTIQVQAAQTQQTTAVPNSLVQPQTPLTTGEVQIIERNNPWAPNYLTAIFALLWLATIGSWAALGFVKRDKVPPPREDYTVDGQVGEKLAWKRVIKAANKQNPTDVQNHLPDWLAALHGKQQPINLADALELANTPEINQAISQMQASQFAKNKGDWNTDKLQKLLANHRRKYIGAAEARTQLTPLNP